MIYKIENLEDLQRSGVYCIHCIVSDTYYLGSTIMTIQKRLWHHICLLRKDKHKNKHLQRAFNKYGEENFTFGIIEITNKNETLIREQHWLDEYKSKNIKLYNVNPLATGTPSLDKETITKRAATMRRKYASGELIPYFKGKPTWNKGLTKENYDYSYLRVKKTITDKLLQARKKIHENRRNQVFPEIYVYDIQYNFLGKWRCSKDLEEWSLTEDNNLPIKSRFSGEMRMGKPKKFLCSGNIIRACNTKESYKNLYFTYKPLHQETDVEKLDKLLETPEEDNQQPTQKLNASEGFND